MHIAAILAPLDGATGSEAVVKTGIAVAKQFGAVAEFLHVAVDPASALLVPGDGMSGAAAEEIMASVREASEARASVAQALYEEHCVKAGLPLVEPGTLGTPGTFAVGWRQITGDPIDDVPRLGRLFDLSILAQPDRESGGVGAATFEAALFYSGRPVLSVPTSWSGGCGEAVTIAWNGTQESVHALGAALPFLLQAKTVTVATVSEDGAEHPDAVPPYLARHGITATVREIVPDETPVSEALMNIAAEASSDLLVMGGYGHSRLRELVLGGATRGVLANALIPVLMAH